MTSRSWSRGRSRSAAKPYLVVWVQRFGVDQILAFVLQFDVGADRVNTQTDACFLQFPGLLVEALGERDSGVRRRRAWPRALRIRRYWSMMAFTTISRAVFSSARACCVPSAADLVRANFLEVQDGLRNARAGLDDL